MLPLPCSTTTAGASVISSYNNGGYAQLSGTSIATPLVAGAAARLRATGACTAVADCTTKLKCMAAANLVTGAVGSSPNLLLNVMPRV